MRPDSHHALGDGSEGPPLGTPVTDGHTFDFPKLLTLKTALNVVN